MNDERAIHLVTCHGIRVKDWAYATPMAKRLGLAGAFTSLYWSPYVYKKLMKWEGLLLPDERRPWMPWNRWKRAALREARKAALWVQLYKEPEIHREILDYACNEIQKAKSAGERRLLFVGHSLGTVVLFDALRTMIGEGALPQGRVAGLVSMGSPLHIWREPTALRHLLGTTLGPDWPPPRWLNLYDADDVVGSRLNPLDQRIEDVEVDTGGVFSSHVGYWESERVTDIIRGVMAEAR